MSLIKILDINVDFIRKSASDNFVSELSHEVEAKLARLDDIGGLPYEKSNMIQLIRSIEEDKMKCLKGETNAKRLYRDVDYALSGGEALGSCHGRVLEEEGRESGKFPYPMKKAD
jgi:hypothetical protein